MEAALRRNRWNTPSFPLEVFEEIMSVLARLPQRNASLWSCALTCRSWVPRARNCLYFHVGITGSLQFDKFLRTITLSTRHGDLVRELSIAVNLAAPGRFLPAGVVLISLCRKLNRLDLIDIVHTSVRPHGNFFLCATQYRTVTVLSLRGYTFSDTKELATFIVSFRELRTLKIVRDGYDSPRAAVFRKGLYEMEMPHLENLELELTHTAELPRPASARDVVHIIDWLAKSSASKKIKRLWMSYTIESNEKPLEAVERIGNLLEACGESLQELVLALQIASDMRDTWDLNHFGT